MKGSERNKKCPCGSGKKWKKCCWDNGYIFNKDLNKYNKKMKTDTIKNTDESYKPIIKDKILVGGIMAEIAQQNSVGMVSVKGFKHSLQANFSRTADDLLVLVGLPNSVNEVLIIINKDDSAKIYTKFPLSMHMGVKRDIKKGSAIFKEDIFDISKIEFKDAMCEIKFKQDDKVIFLFRKDWKFGLFYDFTQEIDTESLKEELGYYYKRLFYYDLYSFVENEVFFNDLRSDGWFPFIRLIGKDFDSIMGYYREGKKHDFRIDNLISEFTKDKIESFTQYWWRKPLFKDKREILEAGVNAFLQNDSSGFINCLHTLYPQIEGIMGIDYFNSHGKKPSFKELISHIEQKAETKFDNISPTGFPNEFYKYLEEVILKNFDLTTGKIDLSRHTVSHGYASADDFNKAKALQVILLLDQIYFYL